MDWSICEFWQGVYESDSLQELLSKLNEYTNKSGNDIDYVEGYLSPYNLFLQNLEKEVENYEKQIQIGYKNMQHFYVIESIHFLCVKYDNFFENVNNKELSEYNKSFIFFWKEKIMNVF